MGFAVVMGAQCMCTMGAAPSQLSILPSKVSINNKPAANILDIKPGVNIPIFGTCTSKVTPAGPGPCTPMSAGTWTPGKPNILINGKPSINNSSKLMCAFGGVVSILYSGTTNTMI